MAGSYFSSYSWALVSSKYLYIFAMFAWSFWAPATLAKIVAVDVLVKEDISGGKVFGALKTKRQD